MALRSLRQWRRRTDAGRAGAAIGAGEARGTGQLCQGTRRRAAASPSLIM